MKDLETLKILVAELEKEMNSFYRKGNKTASIRARKKLQEIRDLCKNSRANISNYRSIMKKINNK